MKPRQMSLQRILRLESRPVTIMERAFQQMSSIDMLHRLHRTLEFGQAEGAFEAVELGEVVREICWRGEFKIGAVWARDGGGDGVDMMTIGICGGCGVALLWPWMDGIEVVVVGGDSGEVDIGADIAPLMDLFGMGCENML